MMPQEQSLSLDAPDNKGICRSTQSIQLVKYIAHPMVAVTIRVEFNATLPTQPQQMVVNQTIAWEAVLPLFNAEGNVRNSTIDVPLQIGPGNTAMKDLLWATSNDVEHLAIRLTGDISAEKVAPVPRKAEEMLQVPQRNNRPLP